MHRDVLNKNIARDNDTNSITGTTTHAGSKNFNGDLNDCNLNGLSVSTASLLSILLLVAASFVLYTASEPKLPSLSYYEILDANLLTVNSHSTDYGQYGSGMFAYPFLESALLAEPYKDAIFNITNSIEGYLYNWTFEGPIDQDYYPIRTVSGYNYDGLMR